ncbi:MAG: hypothetical protein EXR62_07650 [Chloroflexi bacterium]|nr:hypothetical protein [Chloroflexota bacterium]
MIVQSDAHWMPQDPVTEKRLIVVLARMARYVLTEKQDVPSSQDANQYPEDALSEQLAIDLILQDIPKREPEKKGGETIRNQETPPIPVAEEKREVTFEGTQLLLF